MPRILHPRADLGDPDLKANSLGIWNLPSVETLILSSHLLAICCKKKGGGEDGIPSLTWLREDLKRQHTQSPVSAWRRQKVAVITAARTHGASDVPAPTQALPNSKGV